MKFELETTAVFSHFPKMFPKPIKALENILEKGENAGNQIFSFSLYCTNSMINSFV